MTAAIGAGAPAPGPDQAWHGRPGGDPDPDGVAPLAAVLLGVAAALVASRFTPAWWPQAAAVVAVALATALVTGPSVRRAPRSVARPTAGPAAAMTASPVADRVAGPVAGLPGPGVAGFGRRPPRAVVPAAALVVPGALALVTLAMAAMAVTGVRLALVRSAVLPGLAGAAVTVRAVVAAEPQQTRYGGRLVRLTVTGVQHGRTARRTRERAALLLPAAAGQVALGDRLILAATVRRAAHTDPLAWRAPVDLRRPDLLSREPSRSLPLRLSGAIRARAREQALASLPPERAGLLAGMALGDTSLLRGDVEAAFDAAGMTHLLAVSGANLAVLLGAALGLALLLGAGRPVLGAAGITLVAAFVVLTRWEPSVLRAGVMAALALAGVATGRGPGGRRALCLAVALLLLADPALAFSLGFLLSVTATAGILWLGPPLARALPARLPEAVRVAAAGTLAAQAVAVPVAALATGSMPLAGLPANLLALPLAAAPMLLGLLNAVFAVPAPWAADLACLAAGPFLAGLVGIARWAQAAGGELALPEGPGRLLLLALPAAVALLGRGARRPTAPGARGRPP